MILYLRLRFIPFYGCVVVRAVPCCWTFCDHKQFRVDTLDTPLLSEYSRSAQLDSIVSSAQGSEDFYSKGEQPGGVTFPSVSPHPWALAAKGPPGPPNVPCCCQFWWVPHWIHIPLDWVFVLHGMQLPQEASVSGRYILMQGDPFCWLSHSVCFNCSWVIKRSNGEIKNVGSGASLSGWLLLLPLTSWGKQGQVIECLCASVFLSI